jgi:hypothetical protein
VSVVRQDVIAKGFEATVDEGNFFLLNSRLHDFGFRGCTSTEQVPFYCLLSTLAPYDSIGKPAPPQQLLRETLEKTKFLVMYVSDMIGSARFTICVEVDF